MFEYYLNNKDEKVIEIGRGFSKLIKGKYFSHLKDEEWFEGGNGIAFNEFRFGQTESSIDKSVTHLVTNVLYFGTRPIHEQFSMKIAKSWKGDFLEFAFGLEAWETNKEFCKQVFNDFITYLNANNHDLLISTFPVNETCLPDRDFQFVPTGEKSSRIVDTFKKAGAKANYGVIYCDDSDYRFAIKDVEHLLLVPTRGYLSDKEQLEKAEGIPLHKLLEGIREYRMSAILEVDPWSY